MRCRLCRDSIHGGIFCSPSHAYEWALTICDNRMGSRSIIYDPDFIGATGVPMDYAHLDAIQILEIQEGVCTNGCPRFDVACFARWFMPKPTVVLVLPSREEVERIHACTERFADRLKKAGFLG